MAVISTSCFGCNVDSFTIPGSSTLVTSDGHGHHSDGVLFAVTGIYRYFCRCMSSPSDSPPFGPSKLGGLLEA